MFLRQRQNGKTEKSKDHNERFYGNFRDAWNLYEKDCVKFRRTCAVQSCFGSDLNCGIPSLYKAEDSFERNKKFLSAIVILFPYVLMTGKTTLGRLDKSGWICLLIIGLVHTGITYCMYFSSLKELPGQKAAILSYIDPLVAVLISVFVLGETMTGWQAAGGVLILGFTLWNEIS